MILKIKEEWRELHSVPLSIKCVSSSLLSSFLSVCQSVPEQNNSVNTVVSTTPSSIFYHGVVPTGSPSCGGDVAVYVFEINQPSLPTPFYSILVSVSVFMVLSTVFHSINSPDNSLLSHSFLLVLFCLTGPFNYLSLYKSLPLSQP